MALKIQNSFHSSPIPCHVHVLAFVLVTRGAVRRAEKAIETNLLICLVQLRAQQQLVVLVIIQLLDDVVLILHSHFTFYSWPLRQIEINNFLKTSLTVGDYRKIFADRQEEHEI